MAWLWTKSQIYLKFQLIQHRKFVRIPRCIEISNNFYTLYINIIADSCHVLTLWTLNPNLLAQRQFPRALNASYLAERLITPCAVRQLLGEAFEDERHCTQRLAKIGKDWQSIQ